MIIRLARFLVPNWGFSKIPFGFAEKCEATTNGVSGDMQIVLSDDLAISF
jgi:hypothetical protein